MNEKNPKDIEVFVALPDSGVRGIEAASPLSLRRKIFSPTELKTLIKDFLDSVGPVLEETAAIPVGDFEFAELHLNAAITSSAKGEVRLAILSAGGEIGVSGGLSFVFRKRA